MKHTSRDQDKRSGQNGGGGGDDARGVASGGGVEGEGSYTGTRRYNEHLKKHLETHDIDAEAREAREALDGDEREELRAAEARGKAGPGGGGSAQREKVEPRRAPSEPKRQQSRRS